MSDSQNIESAIELMERSLALLKLEATVLSSTLNESQKKSINSTVDNQINEWYAFQHYSEFRWIDDQKFHELRTAFVNAGELLLAYIGRDEWNDRER